MGEITSAGQSLYTQLWSIVPTLDLGAVQTKARLEASEITLLQDAKGLVMLGLSEIPEAKLSTLRSAADILKDKTRLLFRIDPFFRSERDKKFSQVLGRKFLDQFLSEQERILCFDATENSAKSMSLRSRSLALCAIAYGLSLLMQFDLETEAYAQAVVLREEEKSPEIQEALERYETHCRQGRWDDNQLVPIIGDISYMHNIIAECVKKGREGKWGEAVSGILGINHYLHAARAMGLLKLVMEAVNQGAVVVNEEAVTDRI